VHELVSECSSFCKEFDTQKKREVATNVACIIIPSGEIFDSDGVTAEGLETMIEGGK
jgi:hypothetical protein